MVESLTNRWILTLGLATLCFGISLFVLRIPIRTIGIFFALGIPLILLWLYVGDKSKQQQLQWQKKVETTGDPSSNNNQLVQHQQKSCMCPICKHEQAEICLNQKCACCIIMRDNNVVGHSINPLQ
ncbi:MAG: hypothetical protein ACJ719_08845 [Nitrososphaeraceae archaeon]|jgi:hypothetical protein